MMPLESLLAFLGDTRPEVRRGAVRLLADETVTAPEALLVHAIFDDDPEVGRTACEILLGRQPWLALVPFRPRPLPSTVPDTMQTMAWKRFTHALDDELHTHPVPPERDALLRWVALPGAVPDVVDALERAGHTGSATMLAAEADLYGDGLLTSRQILLAPTYECNLDCAYCYAKGWNTWFNGGMKREDLAIALAWCGRQGINSIVLAGGEPTVYPAFSELLSSARERRIAIVLTSNLLYPPSIQPLVKLGSISQLVCHYNPERMSNNQMLDARFKSNLKAAVANDLPVHLRYTLTEESCDTEWRTLMDLAGSFGIKTLNYGFAFQNFLANNQLVRHEIGQSDGPFERVFEQFEADSRAWGLRLRLCKPIPLCVFSERNLATFILSGALRSACAAYRRGFSQNLTINPDLTTFPCNALGVRGPKITEFENLKDAGNYHAAFIEQLLRSPMHIACERCLFHYRGFCQGTCLAEKYSMRQEHYAGHNQ